MKSKILKKATALFFCTLMVFLVSCGGGGNPKTATYGNFKDISFYEAFEDYADEMVEEAEELGEEASYELKIEDGWKASEELNENTLNDDEKAITYSFEYTSKSDYGNMKGTIKFFMVLDNGDNTVSARGMYLVTDDSAQEGSQSAAKNYISDIYSDY